MSVFKGHRSWVEVLQGVFARRVVVENGAILSAIWTGIGIVSAPDPENYGVAQIGANQDGVAAAQTYHIVGAVGSKAWVATGGTVQQLYGGA